MTEILPRTTTSFDYKLQSGLFCCSELPWLRIEHCMEEPSRIC